MFRESLKGAMALEDSVPTDYEHFRSAVLGNAITRPTIKALETWGLSPDELCGLLYLCEHGQSCAENSANIRSTSAEDLQRQIAKLAKRIRRFNNLPENRRFLGSLKIKARNASPFALWGELIRPQSRSSMAKLSLADLIYGPVSVSSVTAIERLPQVLQEFAWILKLRLQPPADKR